jgi:hypothetical protein
MITIDPPGYENDHRREEERVAENGLRDRTGGANCRPPLSGRQRADLHPF